MQLKCNIILFYHIGDDATSIPSQCCVLPYTLNGGLYYNCTVKATVSSQFGCYLPATGEYVFIFITRNYKHNVPSEFAQNVISGA